MIHKYTTPVPQVLKQVVNLSRCFFINKLYPNSHFRSQIYILDFVALLPVLSIGEIEQFIETIFLRKTGLLIGYSLKWVVCLEQVCSQSEPLVVLRYDPKWIGLRRVMFYFNTKNGGASGFQIPFKSPDHLQPNLFLNIPNLD